MECERSLQQIDLKEEQLLALVKQAFPECQKLYDWHPLSGGALNTTYKFKIHNGTYVLRIYARGRSYCKTENAIYRLIHKTVSTPKLIYTDEAHEPWAFSIFTFVDGCHPFDVPVQDRLRLSSVLGQSLAKIHAYKLPAAGLFGEGMSIDLPFRAESSPYYDEAFSVLSKSHHARNHLGAQLADKALSFMEKQKDFFPIVYNNTCLTHSDFKPVSLLYDSGSLSVLDWEFAHAGIGILDFSLLLRHRGQFPLDLTALVKGYEEYGGNLPEEWYRQALITDFVNIATLLDSPAERPQLNQQLKNAIHTTIDNWNTSQL